MLDIHSAISTSRDNPAGQVCMKMPKGLDVLPEFGFETQKKCVIEVGVEHYGKIHSIIHNIIKEITERNF